MITVKCEKKSFLKNTVEFFEIGKEHIEKNRKTELVL